MRGEDVALIGRRDQGQWYGHEALAVSGILDLPWATIAPDGTAVRPTALAETASTVLDRVAASDVSGFWIHVDADVLNPEVMPAVGSPEPGGPDIDELAALLAPLVDHPKALGIAARALRPLARPRSIVRGQAGGAAREVAPSVGDDMPRRLEIVGAPSSAGAYAPGQERAPQAYRAAGLLGSPPGARHRGHRPGRRARLPLADRPRSTCAP